MHTNANIYIHTLPYIYTCIKNCLLTLCNELQSTVDGTCGPVGVIVRRRAATELSHGPGLVIARPRSMGVRSASGSSSNLKTVTLESNVQVSDTVSASAVCVCARVCMRINYSMMCV
jgi:hypothetical protein